MHQRNVDRGRVNLLLLALEMKKEGCEPKNAGGPPLTPLKDLGPQHDSGTKLNATNSLSEKENGFSLGASRKDHNPTDTLTVRL